MALLAEPGNKKPISVGVVAFPRAPESKNNTAETRMFLVFHMPEQGAEFETFLA